jgi:hypothetical protein
MEGPYDPCIRTDLCVSRLPPVSLEARVNMVSRARARRAADGGENKGEKIRMQQLFKGRLRGGRARACYK